MTRAELNLVPVKTLLDITKQTPYDIGIRENGCDGCKNQPVLQRGNAECWRFCEAFRDAWAEANEIELTGG